MATGLLYDVHGNLPALDAVLADARDTEVTRWVLGGDYASFGGWPSEVIARMDELDDAVWIRGNWDRWQRGEREDMPPGDDLQSALASVVEALGPELIARLADLPDTPSRGRRPVLPRRTEHGHGLVHARPRWSTTTSFWMGSTPVLWCSVTPICRSTASTAGSICSTPGAWGCRSTATSARIGACCTTTGAPSCAASPTTSTRRSRPAECYGDASVAGRHDRATARREPQRLMARRLLALTSARGAPGPARRSRRRRRSLRRGSRSRPTSCSTPRAGCGSRPAPAARTAPMASGMCPRAAGRATSCAT